MRKKILWVIVLAVLGVASVSAVTVYVFQIPGKVVVEEVTSEQYEIEAFEDATATKPLTYVDWGSLKPGESKRLTFYIKNTADSTIPSYIVELISDVHNWGGQASYNPIEAGQIREISVDLNIASDASLGEHDVVIKITCPVP
jgi:hypothetical protein